MEWWKGMRKVLSEPMRLPWQLLLLMKCLNVNLSESFKAYNVLYSNQSWTKRKIAQKCAHLMDFLPSDETFFERKFSIKKLFL